MSMEQKRQVVYTAYCSFGTDPEFFFANKLGRVIGAEKVIPEKGLQVHHGNYKTGYELIGYKFTLDGVQCELNTGNFSCRAGFSSILASCFNTLKGYLDDEQQGKGYKPDFRLVARITQKELDSLSEKARVLGCAPSKNVYGPHNIEVNPGYRYRSAAGHIHVGCNGYPYLKKNVETLVKVYDVVVGNTCVLVDRNPSAAARRKLYGRAGEYRTPSHGVEYRVPSNFWLRSYPLVSMIFGLTRLANNITERSHHPSRPGGQEKWDAAGELLGMVDQEKVIKAINSNDADLAWENFGHLKKFLKAHVPTSESMALDCNKVDNFERFAKKVQKSSMKEFFPHDPFTYWTEHYNNGSGGGFETFISKQ